LSAPDQTALATVREQSGEPCGAIYICGDTADAKEEEREEGEPEGAKESTTRLGMLQQLQHRRDLGAAGGRDGVGREGGLRAVVGVGRGGGEADSEVPVRLRYAERPLQELYKSPIRAVYEPYMNPTSL